LEPKEAAQVAAALIQAMAKTTPPYKASVLATALSAVASRMEQTEAAVVLRQAAGILTQVIGKTKAPDRLVALATGLSALASRMELKEAALVSAHAAKALILAMQQKSFAVALVRVLTNPEPSEHLRRTAAVVAAVGISSDGSPSLGTCFLLQPAVDPLPCRL